MDPDRSRLFLLSVIAVPAACGPGVPGGSLGAVGPIPTADDDNALDPTQGDDGDGRPGPDGCLAYYAAFVACYSDGPYVPGSSAGYSTSGYSTTGYTLDEGGTLPPIGYYCTYFYGELVAVGGRGCASAVDDVYACLAPFACQDLDGSVLDSICREPIAAAEAVCPDVSDGGAETGFFGTTSG
jgi:hypothetical protein